jgi:hypothetical protein
MVSVGGLRQKIAQLQRYGLWNLYMKMQSQKYLHHLSQVPLLLLPLCVKRNYNTTLRRNYHKIEKLYADNHNSIVKYSPGRRANSHLNKTHLGIAKRNLLTLCPRLTRFHVDLAFLQDEIYAWWDNLPNIPLYLPLLT